MGYVGVPSRLKVSMKDPSLLVIRKRSSTSRFELGLAGHMKTAANILSPCLLTGYQLDQ